MEPVICIPFNNEALDRAGTHLIHRGFLASPLPGSDVTHLLLPIPSFDDLGNVRGGGSLEALLRQLPQNLRVIGGNLNHPALVNYSTTDLLQDPYYLACNANITAHCAIKYIINALPVTLSGQSVLIIGWGRIGKCLAKLLKGLDARVSILPRKDADRAMALALGYEPAEADLSRYRVIINTAPAAVIAEDAMALCRPDCCKLDLASVRGLPGRDVIWARGLPGKDTPESSGKLIAESVIRLISGKEANA